MRLLQRLRQHVAPPAGGAFDWLADNDLIYADGAKLYRWSSTRCQAALVCQLQIDSSATPTWTQLRCAPGPTADLPNSLFLCTDDGKLWLLPKVSRPEKTIQAHQGAILCACWSFDGSSIATGGEDGEVKIWSRGGLLRSSLAKVDNPIHDVRWSADGGRLFFSSGNSIHVQDVRSAQHLQSWKAHSGMATCFDYFPPKGLIASGSEDGQLKIWNESAKLLFSANFSTPITAICWAQDAKRLWFASLDCIFSASPSGQHVMLEEIANGLLNRLTWSKDGSLFAVGCWEGGISFYFLHLITSQWKHIEATLISESVIETVNLEDEVTERLEVSGLVTRFSMAYGHLVVTTEKDCYIFWSENWSTPHIFKLKFIVLHIALAERIMALTNGFTYAIHAYDGRLVSTIDLESMEESSGIYFSRDAVALCNDVLCIRHLINRKRLDIYDSMTGKLFSNSSVMHNYDIVQVSVEQTASLGGRKIAFVDINDNCFLVKQCNNGRAKVPRKLEKLVRQVMFNDATDMLIGVQEENLLLWYNPGLLFLDQQLMQRSVLRIERKDIGKWPTVEGFYGSHVVLERADGCRLLCILDTIVYSVNSFLKERRWDKAIQTCRQSNEMALWTAVAVAAALCNEVSVTKLCFAAIDEVEKVDLIKGLNGDTSDIQMALLLSDVDRAEQLLLEMKRYTEAIQLNTELNRWNRALDLAGNDKTHLNMIVELRKRFLMDNDEEESDDRFIQLEEQVGN